MRVVVYGSRADGHARVVIELLVSGDELEVVGLIDDYPENAGRTIGGVRIVGQGGDLGRLADEGIEGVLLGFGAARGRKEVLAAVEGAGLALPVLVHPTAHVASSADLQPGCQVLPGAIVGAGARIGRGALINSGAIVEHDVRLADAVVIDPGAVLTGRVTVGASTEVGSGAVVLPDVRIGARVVIGAGAVVTKHVPADTTVVGVPARPLAARPTAPVTPPEDRPARGSAGDPR
jgi:sugar O-acyltransferase (sialic acid O-acetyltransferase NeuD family)